MKTIGTVIGLFRYPVKSMLGESLESSEITEGGLVGDRAFCLYDLVWKKPLSAKKLPELFEFKAQLVTTSGATPTASVTLPGGDTLSLNDRDAKARLEACLGRQISIEQSIPRGFFDDAAVHVMTTATLAKLHELYLEGDFDVRRFRPNIVVDTSAYSEQGFIENGWIGHRLAVGETELRVSAHCSRCIMTTLPQAELPQDSGILKTAVMQNESNVGIYAAVTAGGIIRLGDRVCLI